MLVGVQETLTDVTVGDSDEVKLIDPPQPISNKKPKNERTNRALRVMAFFVKSGPVGELGYGNYRLR
jgi:hypothetical protein